MELVRYFGAVARVVGKVACPGLAWDEGKLSESPWSRWQNVSRVITGFYYKLLVLEQVTKTYALRPIEWTTSVVELHLNQEGAFRSTKILVTQLRGCLSVFQLTKPVFELMRLRDRYWLRDLSENAQTAAQTVVWNRPCPDELINLKVALMFIKFFIDSAVGLSFLGEKRWLNKINALSSGGNFVSLARNCAVLMRAVLNLYQKYTPRKSFEEIIIRNPEDQPDKERKTIKDVLSFCNSFFISIATACKIFEIQIAPNKPLATVHTIFSGCALASGILLDHWVSHEFIAETHFRHLYSRS